MPDTRRILIGITDPDKNTLAEGEYARARIAQLRRTRVGAGRQQPELR